MIWFPAWTYSVFDSENRVGRGREIQGRPGTTVNTRPPYPHVSHCYVSLLGAAEVKNQSWQQKSRLDFVGTPRLGKEREWDRGRQKVLRVGLILFRLILPCSESYCSWLVSEWIIPLIQSKMYAWQIKSGNNKNRIKVNQNHPLSLQL